MALQRTRRPRIRSGRSLRSLGSPLNAYPLGRVIAQSEDMRPTRIAIAILVISVLGGAALPGDIVVPTPRPLALWLNDVTFLGVGSISKITINPETGRAAFSVAQVEAWKGVAPSVVSFVEWPFGYSGLSEGQRVVFYSFHGRVTRSGRRAYLSPAPVVRINGLECFRFDYAGQAILPQSTVAVVYRGKAKELGLSPLVLLDRFRAAVKATASLKAAA